MQKIPYNLSREAKQEVPKNARKDHNGMHRVQAEKLRHDEKQEKRSRQTRDEQVLQILQKAHTA